MESKHSELLAEIVAISGMVAGNTVDSVDVGHLRRLTQKQLHDLARRMSLSGYSRLNKDALAARLWVEVERLLGGRNEKAPPQEKVDMEAIREPSLNVKVESNAILPLEARTNDRGLPGREIPVTHRFEEPGAAPTPSREADILPKEIPWGYGRDRVTAMPVDPERLFVYWEVLGDSIEKARGQLGAGGPTAWLNLRLYDTSGRIFDGTNAHSTQDQKVDRDTRQWFFDIGRPSSELIVELGMLSNEGYFAKIARSSRVEFPRREPVAWSEPEWMTVRASTGHVERSNVRSQVKSTGSAIPGAQPPLNVDGLPGWLVKHVEWQDVARFAQRGVEQQVEWEELRTDGTLAFHRRISWESPTMITSWESGPFSYPVEVPLPVREAFVGKTRVFRLGDRTHIVYGPWQVVIRGMGAHHSRAVLSRWEVFRSWQTTAAHVVHSFVAGTGDGASERLLRGASELAYAGGSELRFGGASELYRLGASELRFAGASETLFAAASENILRGASERRFAGASEYRFAGGSEVRLMGGSESRLLGGSEARLAGGSEARLAESSYAYPSTKAPPSGPSGNG